MAGTMESSAKLYIGLELWLVTHSNHQQLQPVGTDLLAVALVASRTPQLLVICMENAKWSANTQQQSSEL